MRYRETIEEDEKRRCVEEVLFISTASGKLDFRCCIISLLYISIPLPVTLKLR